MSISWDDSYHGKLRALVGDEQVLLFVGARVVVLDAAGRVLLIRRSDNGKWAMPAGSIDLGESIVECAARELHEETGLRPRGELTPIAIHSGAEFTNTNEWGHTYQLFTTTFLLQQYEGELLTATDETTDAGFFDYALAADGPQPGVSGLPEPLAYSVALTLVDLAAYQEGGRLVLR